MTVSLQHPRSFYIDGAWVEPSSGSRTVDVINPATEEPVQSISFGTDEDVVRAIEAAQRAFPSYSQTSLAERKELLASICASYEKRLGDVAEAITIEMGAPFETLSKPLQAPVGLWHFHTALALMDTYPFERVQGTTRLVKEPVGVCSLISPWNWPINQSVCKLAPALAAGCTVVLKPSQYAPLSALVLAEILHDAGVPKGVFNMINGEGAKLGRMLASHPLVDMVSLTGSTAAGVSISKDAADTVKRVSLELGGKSANIILEGADLEKAVTHGVHQMMGNTGQSCNAPSRMLVPAARMEEVERVAAQACAQLTVGDPLAPLTTVGPVANRRQYLKVQSMIEQGLAEGAHLVAGGLGRPEGLASGFYAKPTVFSRVHNAMTVAQEEIFGPVLVIIPYEDEQDAVRIANDSVYGLSGYVYGATVDHAREVARRLRTGMVHLNGAFVDVAAPFGGYKQSGNGREWGAYGFDEFTEVKAIMGSEV